MKKMLSRAVLATGILALCASAANAAIIRFSREVSFTLDSNGAPPPPTIISLPRYNAADFGGFPLRSITLLAEGRTIGSYRIFNRGGRITLTNLGIGAETPIIVPTNSPITIELTPVPVTNFPRIVVNTNQLQVFTLDGQDTAQVSIPTSDFNLFEGTGDLAFPISAALVTEGRQSFIPPIDNDQFINLSATTRLSVIYENTDPLEIPERGFNLSGLVLFGIAGLALKTTIR